MKTSVLLQAGIATILQVGCASTMPKLAEPMADVESANRSANELGAQQDPKAKLYVKLAEEQLLEAKAAIKNDEEEKAARLLQRAKADAELALALTRGGAAKARADRVREEQRAGEAVSPSERPMP